MKVAEAVGRCLVAHGVDHVFGVVGSGNFHVTNAMIAAGARFIAAAHEAGAASMADGYARVSGRVPALSVHQGPGVTNALTGIVEAAKSRTPMVVLAPEATQPRSNFFVDLPGIAAAIGAGFRRVRAERVVADVTEACRSAAAGAGQTIVLALPLDVQSLPAGDAADLPFGAATAGAPGSAASMPPIGATGTVHGGTGSFGAVVITASASSHSASGDARTRTSSVTVSSSGTSGSTVSVTSSGTPGGVVSVSSSGSPGIAVSVSPGGTVSVSHGGSPGDAGAAASSDRPIVPVVPLVGPLVDALAIARRPVFIAGRGAARNAAAARAQLSALAERCGALLAVSAAAKGLFAGDPWNLDVSGGFATPLAAELIAQADLIVAWGSTLNMWTTRHGRLVSPGAKVAQVDLEPAALGVNRTVDLAICGELAGVARACTDELARRGPPRMGWRSPELGARIAREGRWRQVAFADQTGGGHIDPRTLSIALDDLIPAERTVVIDSGNFMGYPSMFLSVPDAAGFCFTQAFQSIGLGLASALGAAVARPDRLTVAALGDGGFLMSVAELTTAVRLGVPLLIVVYNDAAYGAEVHHFGPHGHPLGTVTFPDTDLAAMARGFGCAAVTVRAADDLAAVGVWLAGPRDRPLVVDAKVVSSHASWWLEEAFRGH